PYTTVFRSNKNNTVRQNCFHPQEIFDAAFAIVIPAEDRSKGKQYQANHQQIFAPHREAHRKGGLSQSCTIQITSPDISNNQRQPSQCTNNDSINKSTGHRNQPLFGGPFCFSSSSNDWGTAKTGFVRENTAGNTITHCHHNSCAQKAASGSRRTKSISKHCRNSCRHLIGKCK